MTNSKLTDEQLTQIHATAREARLPVVWTAKRALAHFKNWITPEMVEYMATELQERRKADSDGMSAGNYCYHYKAEGENGCYAGVANVSDQVVDWNTFQAFKITVGRLNGDKITGITSLSFLGEVNKS